MHNCYSKRILKIAICLHKKTIVLKIRNFTSRTLYITFKCGSVLRNDGLDAKFLNKKN